MKRTIIVISAFSLLGLMLVSCSSEPETTTTTTRQTTVTTPPPPTMRPQQRIRRAATKSEAPNPLRKGRLKAVFLFIFYRSAFPRFALVLLLPH